jgi:hypothetical protein
MNDDRTDSAIQAAEPHPNETVKYYSTGNLEAHIIADMLRIESISTELKSFKDSSSRELAELKINSNQRFDKLENWIVAIVGLAVTTLIAVVVGIVI